MRRTPSRRNSLAARRPLLGSALLLVLVLAVGGQATAEPTHDRHFSLTAQPESDPLDARPAELPRPPDIDRLADPPGALDTDIGLTDSPDATPAAGAAEPHVWWAALVSAGVVGGAAINSFTDDYSGGFHAANEGWFGKNTYAGGADKASHFASFEIIAKEVDTFYRYLHFSPRQARIGGFVVSCLAGTIIEIGDAGNKYGFSYEDLVADYLGAGAAVLISATGTADLVGFRFGPVPGSAPPQTVEGKGRDYSHEIYTADLKLAGLSERLGWHLGWARFLLLSATYGVKGYPYGASDTRERQVGFEVGLDFGSMLHAINVGDDTWWGIATHLVVDNVRIPYTAGGFRYDVNHHQWLGPDTGNSCGTCN